MSEKKKSKEKEPIAIVCISNEIWSYEDWKEAFIYPEEYFDPKKCDIIIKEKLAPIYFIFDDLSIKKVIGWWRIAKKADPMKITDELTIEGVTEVWMEHFLGEEIKFEQLPLIIKKKIEDHKTNIENLATVANDLC